MVMGRVHLFGLALLLAAVPAHSCFQNLSRWTIPPREIVQALGVDLTSSPFIIDGDHAWIDLSEHPKALEFFGAHSVALHGSIVNGQFEPEHFVVRPRAEVRLDKYALVASDRDYTASFERALRKRPGWYGKFWDGMDYQLPTRYSLVDGIMTSLLTPASVYAPFKYSSHLMVEAVRELRNKSPKRILVLGSGSGFDTIGVALAFPDAEVVGADLSRSAVVVGEMNAQLHGLQQRVKFVESDLFERVAGEFDAILFVAPRAIDDSDLNRVGGVDNHAGGKYTDSLFFDLNGKILKRFVSSFRSKLSRGGAAFILADNQFKQRFVPDASIGIRPLTEPLDWTSGFPADGQFRIFELK